MATKVANNAFGTLAVGLVTSGTTVTLTSGQGARFPVVGAGTDQAWATLTDATGANVEVVKITAHVSGTDTFTIVRAQDGTLAGGAGGVTFPATPTAARFELRACAALFNDKADLAGANTWAAAQTFGSGITVSAGGATVTAGGLTVAAGTTAVQALTATTGVFSSTIAATSTVTASAFNATSTRRVKRQIRRASDALLRRADNLVFCEYIWTHGPRKSQKDWGYVAEEVQKDFPEAVGVDDAGQATGVDYGRVAALHCARLEQRIRWLEERVRKLEK